jgi:hypothetical protein
MTLKKTAAAATLVAALAGGAVALAPAALADPASFSGCVVGFVGSTVQSDSCRVQEYYSGGRKIGEVTISWFQGRRVESDGCRTFTERGRVLGTSCRRWSNA